MLNKIMKVSVLLIVIGLFFSCDDFISQDNAELSKFSVLGYELDQDLTSGVDSYSTEVEIGADSLVFELTAQHKFSTITIENVFYSEKKVTQGDEGYFVELADGKNTFLITVLAADGETRMSYTLSVIRYDRVDTPAFSPDGAIFDTTQDVTISCSISGSSIYYTTNGSTPSSSNGTLISSGATASIISSCTLKAIAIKSGYSDSSVKSAAFIPGVAEPTFSPDGTVLFPTQEITISCSTSGSSIFYTTNGDIPSSSTGTLISSGATATLTSSFPLKAIAIKSGYSDSSVKIADFTIVTDTSIVVDGGTFNNGTSIVTVSPFSISPYEVTQGDYEAVIGFKPSHAFYGIGANYPVNNISWYAEVVYCNVLSSAKGFTPCYSGSGNDTICDFSANGYRLPTEAEWQFAARGGNISHNYTYSGSDTIGDVAWYRNNSGDEGVTTNLLSHEVGTKAPNELGIFDMSGNLWEWCWDRSGSYSSEAQTDPQGSSSGSYRVLRGGGWDDISSHCTVSIRDGYTPSFASYNFGFRLVRRL